MSCNKPNQSDSGVDQGNKYWSDSVYILEPEPTGLSDRFNIEGAIRGGEQWKRGVKEDYRIYCPEPVHRCSYHLLTEVEKNIWEEQVSAGWGEALYKYVCDAC